MRLRVLAVSVAMACCLLGATGSETDLLGNAPAVDVRPQVKALHLEAAKRGDLWTALQLEAYAPRLELKLKAVLGSSPMHGDAVFAFPQHVVDHWDLGDRVLVATGRRLHQLAPDGRPLILSMPMSGPVSLASVDQTGSVIATVGKRAQDGVYQFVVCNQAIPGGKELLRVVIPTTRAEDINSIPVASHDGSALAVSFHRENAAGVEIYSLCLATKDGTQRQVPNYFRPKAVGANAAWVIAQYALGEDGQLALIQGNQVTTIGSCAPGPGSAAFALPGKVMVIDATGTIRQLPTTIGLGERTRVMSIGRWLAVYSGSGASTAAGLDLLGNPVEGGTPQPATTVFYRWQDLVADTATMAAASMPGYPEVARHQVAAVYQRSGHDVSLLDLSDEAPVVRPLVTASATVEEVQEEHGRTRIDLVGDAWLVLDAEGREVWSGGPAETLEVTTGDHLLLRQAGRYSLARMSADPAKRTAAIPLELPEGRWSVEVDRRGAFVLASNDDRWVLLDPLTGRPTDSGQAGDGGSGPPSMRVDRWSRGERPGRFVHLHGRLFEKALGEDGAPGRKWHPADAWRTRTTLVVMGSDGRLLAGGKRGEITELGRFAGFDHFAQGPANSLLLSDEDGRILAAVGPAGQMTRDPVLREEQVRDLPGGMWRVEGLRFTPSRGGTLEWASERLGFAPLRLRNPEGAGLMVITASLIIELDQALGRLVGQPAGQPGHD